MLLRSVSPFAACAATENRLRASDAFPQLPGLERGKSAAFPCEVLALALKAVGTECRPYQSFDPMAGIDTSQPMSKITLRRILPLEQRYYTKIRPGLNGEILAKFGSRQICHVEASRGGLGTVRVK